jgi:hypothetical protein
LPRGKLSSDGTAAGALLREVARHRGLDAVVGCGGDAPAFYRPWGDPEPATVASALGLVDVGDHVYVAAEMERRRSRYEMFGKRPAFPYQVRAFVVPGAEEVAVAAERSIQPDGAAVVYAPASAVVVGGRDVHMTLVEELVKAVRGLSPP